MSPQLAKSETDTRKDLPREKCAKIVIAEQHDLHVSERTEKSTSRLGLVHAEFFSGSFACSIILIALDFWSRFLSVFAASLSPLDLRLTYCMPPAFLLPLILREISVPVR
jgi:hypothetical protein